SLLSSDMNFGVGLMKHWDFGMSMPMLLAQSVDSDITAFRGEFATTGVTEYRFNTKVRFWGDKDRGIASVATVNLHQIEDNPFTGANHGPTYTIELVGDMTIDKIAMAANVGYRARNPGTPIAGVPVQPFGNQVIGSVAMSYLFESYDTKLIGEIFGSAPTEQQQFISDRELSSAELLLGIKTDVTPNLAFHAGGGTEIYQGTSSPDWRVYTGLNWAIGPLFAQPKEVIVKVESQPLDALMEVYGEDPFQGAPQARETFVAREVLFKFDRAEVEDQFREALERMADYLMQPPGFRQVIIEGHTDSVGSDSYNLNLSQRRASAVRQVLIENGVPASKVRAIGRGESEPIADNGNYQGRAMNRRVEFEVLR
ncbi:MAG: OmpA family protein, partial [Bdellovibrionales bacterium]|nr:OmpA family protein [Bdellovibrionales bacterium]